MSGSGSSSSTTARLVVTTVILRPCRWRAICSVEVPMSIITVIPSCTIAAAARAEAVLDVEALDLDLREARLGAGVDRAAVDAFELAVARQRAEVAPDRHLRHAEALGQVGDVRGPVADGAQDLLASLSGKKGHH